MGLKIFAAALAATVASVACAQPASQPATATGAPKLIVAISVDQLSSDLWDQYRSRFTGGFARLASGTVFRNGYQAMTATEVSDAALPRVN